MVLSERFVFITVPIGAAWLGRRRSRRGRANNWPVDGTGPVVYRSGRAVMVCVLFVFLGFICLVYGRVGQGSVWNLRWTGSYVLGANNLTARTCRRN